MRSYRQSKNAGEEKMVSPLSSTSGDTHIPSDEHNPDK